MKSIDALPRAAAELFDYPLVGATDVPGVPTQRAAAPLATELTEFFAGVTDD